MDTSVVVVISNNKALILRRGPTAPWMPGCWNLPGGGVDPGETNINAAKRECLEETGIVVELEEEECCSIIDPEFVLHVYVARINDAVPKVTLCWENDQYCWITAQDIDTYTFVPYVAEILRQALSTSAQAHNLQ